MIALHFVMVTELSLQHISMLLRCEPDWEVVEPLNNIGKLKILNSYSATCTHIICLVSNVWRVMVWYGTILFSVQVLTAIVLVGRVASRTARECYLDDVRVMIRWL